VVAPEWQPGPTEFKTPGINDGKFPVRDRSAGRLREGTDSGADGGETIPAGGREVFQEVEGGEWIGVTGEDLGRSGITEKVAEEGDEAFHERTIGVTAEIAAAVTEFADEPDL
jgi:hypothetical protein